jgi:hypothetical protein
MATLYWLRYLFLTILLLVTACLVAASLIGNREG